MKKQKMEEAIYLTHQCIAHFWQNDLSFAEALFSKHIMWIGALQKEFIQGREAVAEELKETCSTNAPCHLLQQEFRCILNSRNICAIVGRYLVTTDGRSKEIIQEQQRATFLWQLTDDRLEIAHMHISSPLGYLEEKEMFPHKIGHMTYRYLEEMAVDYRKNQRNIVLRSEDGYDRFVPEAAIEYAEAKNHNTIVTTIEGTIVAKREWKEFLKELGPEMIQVHRSFVINMKYVKALYKTEVEMASGARIPIPVKRYREIHEKITSF